MSVHDPWAYADKVKDHFLNPRNVLKDEEYQEDGKGFVGNIQCGDQMMVAIQVDGDSERITDCKWKTFGCASAIASTSVLSEMVKGMPLEKAYKLSPKEITAELGGLPENKIHCSVLGDKALRAAIADYYERTGQPGKIQEEKAIVVCECMNVTDHEIEEAVLEGARTYAELQEHTKLGTSCGECKDEAISLMQGFIDKHFSGSGAV